MKKVLALMLAVMMIFGLCTVTAFAERPDEAMILPDPDDPNAVPLTVSIGKTLKLANDGTVNPEETFYLIQTGKISTDSSVTGDDIPDLVAMDHPTGYTGTADDKLVGVTTFGEGAVTTAGVRQNIEITLPNYTAVGIYKYTLSEVNNGTAGMTYWGNDILLFITIGQDEDGKFCVTAVHCEEEFDPEDPGANKVDSFTNTYSAGKFSVNKQVTGSLGDRDKYFEFTVTFEGESGKDYSTATGITYDGGSAGLAITGGTGENAVNIDTTNKVIDITGLGTGKKTVTFYLKHGDTVTFDNIPYGVKYTYAEADYSAEAAGGYKTTYQQIASGEKDPETGDPVMVNNNTDIVVNDDTNGASYTVTNDKDRNIDTGIFDLDNLPYIMALAVVLIGGVVFFVSKKRIKAEDRV